MCRLTGTDRHPGTRSVTCRGAQTRREAQPQTIPSSHVYARLPTWHIHSHVCDSHTTCPFCLCVHVLFMLISHMGQTGAHSAPSPLSLRSPHALLHCPGWLAGAPSLRRRGASGSSTPPPGPPRWPPGLISAGRRSPRPGGAEEEGHACGRRPKERRCLRGPCPHWRLCRWVHLPPCPETSPLTFFRTTNSFSAVALRATSSSYLSVGDRGTRAERSALEYHPSSQASSSGGQKGLTCCKCFLLLSMVYFVVSMG